MPLPPGFELEKSNLPEGFILDRRTRGNQAIPQFEQDALNPAGQMSAGQRALAGIGKTFTDVGEGVAQRLGLGPSRQQVDERRDRDVSLMASPEGFTGSIAGGVAATLPAMIAGPSMAAAMGTGAAYGAVQPVGEGESVLLNTALGGAAGAGGKVIGDKLGAVVGAARNKQLQQAAAEKSKNAVRDSTLQAAKDAGYVFPPSAAQGGWFSRRLESIGGKAAVGQEAALRNQGVTDAIARREAGLAADDALSMTNLRNARQNMAAPYREAAAIDPAVAADVEALKAARLESKLQWKAHGRMADPEAYKKATAADQLAKSLEGYIDTAAQNAGRPDLLAALRQSRTDIAKNINVKNSINVGSGSVDASVLGRALDNGAPLTGGLETIAKTQQAFKPYLREASGVPTPGVSKSEALAAALLATGGSAAAGPAGLLAGGLPMLSGPARSLLLSKPYQAMTVKPPSYGGANSTAMANAILNNPQLKALTPSLAAALLTNAEQ